MSRLNTVERAAVRQAVDRTRQAGYHVKLVTDYTGRAMEGSCFGIIGDTPRADIIFCIELGVALTEAGEDYMAFRLARAAQGDKMGKDGLIYFPGWEWA